MVNPGAFRGARKEFLLGEKAAYAQGVEDSYAADALANIWRRYFLRFPIDLPEDQEPTEEELQAVDDNTAIPDVPEPDAETLSPEEYQIAVEALNDRKRRLNYKKAQIKRWMAYQYRKDHDLDPTQSGAHNPFRILLARLLGNTQLDRPRLKTAVNVWRKTRRADIEEEAQRLVVERLANGGKKKKDGLIAARDSVARQMFAELSEEDRNFWKQEAKAEHDAALKRWANEMNGPIPTDPASRQRCIQGLVEFIQPILDYTADGTGWFFSLMGGGPEPAQGGALSIISMHSGRTSGDVKLNFGRSEQAKFRQLVVPMYGRFLRQSFSAEECHSRALSNEEGYIPVAQLDTPEDKASWDQVPLVASRQSPDTAASPTPPPPNVPAPPATAPPPPNVPAPPATTDGSPVCQEALGKSTSDQDTGDADQAEDEGEENPFPFTLQTTPAPSRAASPAPSYAASLPPSRAASAPPSRAASIAPAPAPPAPVPASISPASTSPASAPAVSSAVPPAPALPAATPATPSPASDPAVSSAAPPAPALPAATPASALPTPTTVPMDVDEEQGGHAEALTQPQRRSSRPNKEAKGHRGGNHEAEGGATKGKGRKRGRPEADIVQPAQDGKEERPKKCQAAGSLSTATASTSIMATTSGLTTSGLPDIPSHAPAWFTKAFGMLGSSQLGPEWEGLLRAWAAFEELEGYQSASKLSAQDRPVVVKDWIQRARSTTWRPTITNLPQFGAQLQKWWASLQPKWRVLKDGKVQPGAVEGDWATLRKGGINGLLSVVAALYFWGCIAKEKDEGMVQWFTAVQDVDTVIARMVATK